MGRIEVPFYLLVKSHHMMKLNLCAGCFVQSRRSILINAATLGIQAHFTVLQNLIGVQDICRKYIDTARDASTWLSPIKLIAKDCLSTRSNKQDQSKGHSLNSIAGNES
jgi:hypothetical protein